MNRYRVAYHQEFQGRITMEFQDVYAPDLKRAMTKWSEMILPNQTTLGIHQIHSLNLNA